MTLRNQLLAALAAATLAAPVAFSQEPPSPPSPQDQDSADVGEPDRALPGIGVGREPAARGGELDRVIERHEPVVRAGAAVAGQLDVAAVLVRKPDAERRLDRGQAGGAERRGQPVAVAARPETAEVRVVLGEVGQGLAQRGDVLQAHAITVTVTRRRCGAVRCSHR